MDNNIFNNIDETFEDSLVFDDRGYYLRTVNNEKMLCPFCLNELTFDFTTNRSSCTCEDYKAINRLIDYKEHIENEQRKVKKEFEKLRVKIIDDKKVKNKFYLHLLKDCSISISSKIKELEELCSDET